MAFRKPRAKLMSTAPAPKAFTLQAPELPEGVIQNQILNYLSTVNVFFWRQNSVGVFDTKTQKFRKQRSKFHIKGVADILGVCWPSGRFLAIEVKKFGGYPSKEQKLFLENVNAKGGLGFVARSWTQVRDRLAAEGIDTKSTPLAGDRRE
jgi:hypothetical protein